MPSTRRRWRFPKLLGAHRCLMVWLASLCCGCWGPGEIPLQGDPSAARETLTKVLETWKTGGRPEPLQTEKPPLYVTDFDWNSERVLSAYELVGEPVRNGTNWRVYARLTFFIRGRPARPLPVCYEVTLGRKISVMRGDFAD